MCVIHRLLSLPLSGSRKRCREKKMRGGPSWMPKLEWHVCKLKKSERKKSLSRNIWRNSQEISDTGEESSSQGSPETGEKPRDVVDKDLSRRKIGSFKVDHHKIVERGKKEEGNNVEGEARFIESEDLRQDCQQSPSSIFKARECILKRQDSKKFRFLSFYWIVKLWYKL